MKVPILRISISEEDRAFIQKGFQEVLDSGALTMGKFTAEFEGRFAEFVGSRYAISCNSGTAALELIFRGLGIEGRSVIVPTNTFLATALAVMHAGNRVIFADSDPQTLCLDVQDVARRIAPDTAAVVVVHIGGIIAPAVYALREICRSRGLHLIEDCAHAHGSSINGKKAGTLGTAGAFSFFPTKVLTTGEGGAVTTDHEDLWRRIGMIRNQGKNPGRGNRITEVGHNMRLSEMTAVVGVQQMKRAVEIIARRQEVARLYDDRLTRIKNVRPLKLPEGGSSSYYKYIVYLSEEVDRASLKATMKEKYGISLTGEVYAELCHTEPLWESVTYCGRQRDSGQVRCTSWPGCGCAETQDDFPRADYISRHHVCLPLYPSLSRREIDYVVESLDRVLNG